MSKYITYDYVCYCGHTSIELVERANIPETLECPACTREAGLERKVSANITKASDRDGYRRFDDIREKRKLVKEARKARYAGELDKAAAIKKEASKI